MKRTNKLISFLFIIAISLSVTIIADACNYNTCFSKKQIWKSNNTTMYISTISMPPDSEWDIRLQWAMSEWNAVRGSKWKFYVSRDTDRTVSNSNGKNEIYFIHHSGNELAITYSRYQCYWFFGIRYGYIEADIEFNVKYLWTCSTFTGNSTGSPYNFELVALHELGHALGLNHSNGRVSTMNSYYYNGGPIGHHNQVEPHADDRYGLRILYPDSTTGRNVSASRFHNTGGGASAINSVQTTNGNVVELLECNKQYDIRYTVENLGTQDEPSVRVEFYLSTNSYISTSDIYLGSTTWSIPKGSYVTAQKRITVPNSIATGNYYIGYSVDPHNTIVETDESNNYISLINTVSIF